MNALAQPNQLKEVEDPQQSLGSLHSRPCVRRPEQHLRAPQRIPLVAVSENARGYVLKAELSRVKQEDAKISIEDGTLTITGDRSFDLNRKKDHPAAHACGRFAHSFEVPPDARPAKVNAVFKHEVLTVHLAKSSCGLFASRPEVPPFPTLRLNRSDPLNEPQREAKSGGHKLWSQIVKSFAELSWPVVALDLVDNRDVGLQLPALSPPGTSPGWATPLEAAVQRRRDLPAPVGAWHHGGINE